MLLETGKVAGVKGAARLIVNKSDVLKWINWRQLSPELADITSKLTLSQFKAIKDAYSKNQYVRIYASNKFITQHIKSEIIELCSHGISPQNALKMIQEGDRAYQAKLINLNPQRTEMLHELGFTSIKVSARLGRNLRSLENIYKNNGYDALKKMYDQARGFVRFHKFQIQIYEFFLY